MTTADHPHDVPAVAAGVADAFRAQSPLDFTDPWAVRERCAEVSEEFATVCCAAGLSARVVTGGEFGEMPQFPGIRLLFNGHYAVLVEDGADGLVYDWTARQFDPDCAVPLVCTFPQWRSRWEPIA